MSFWPLDLVRPIRSYFSRKRKSRWKQNWSKGTCPSCKLPFDNGKKRCVVDSCGHDRCYNCLCVQDTCPVCIREAVVNRQTEKNHQRYDKTEKRKSNDWQMRVLTNITNEPTLNISQNASPPGIYQKGQSQTRMSQFLNENEDSSFENILRNTQEGFVPLKPLYFEVPQSETDNSFLYREWVFQEINKVMSSNMKGVLLVGEEGSGKTTLILQLVDWSCFGRKRKSGIISEGILNDIVTFENLASKIVGYHFCQTDCSETCSIPDFVHSLAAQLCQAPQLTEYRNFLMRDPSCQEVLSLENCIRDPDTSFKKGILQPLRSLQSSPLISGLVVIDNLCEDESQRRSIISFLTTYIQELPTWLKVIMSIKTSDVNKVPSLPVHRINLDCFELKVKEDLHRYVRCRINQSEVIQANICSFGEENQVSRFIDHLVGSEKASFLFTRLILDLFQQNYLVIKSSTFNVIPISMDEAFTLTFNLKFPSAVTFNKVKPILEICLASENPLSALEIFYALESGSVVPNLKWADFTQLLRSLHGILIQRKDESLMISHPALRNWLQKNEKFFCDIEIGHTYLSLLLSRMRFPLSEEKKFELVKHFSRSSLYKNDKELRALWLQISSTDNFNFLGHSRTIFWADEKMLHLILQCGADVNALLDNQKKCSIVHEICKSGNISILMMLLKFGAAVDKSDEFGTTPMMKAAEGGYLQILEALLNAGAKVHLQDKVGRCALSCAANNGHLEVIDFLSQTKYWPSPLLRLQSIEKARVVAAGAGHYQICECLSKSLNTSVDPLEIQLGEASSLSRAAVCKLFLTNNSEDFNYFKLAAFHGHVSILQVLIDKGVNINTRDGIGRTALSWACINNQTNVVRFLLDKGSDIKIKDNQQLTPIHLAVIYADTELISLLLNHPSYSEIKDHDGDSPLDCAIKAGNFPTVFELLKCGVQIGFKSFLYAESHHRIYTSLLCKLLSEGISFLKENQFTRASQIFELGLQKCNPEKYQNFFYRLQEKLDECKKHAKTVKFNMN